MNIDTCGRTGTNGTLNARGVLFWGNQRRTIMVLICPKPMKTNIPMAHHFACEISCKPHIIMALSAAEIIQDPHVAICANRAVLSEGVRWLLETSFTGNNDASSLDVVSPVMGVCRLSSELCGCLTRPMVPGWYLRIKTQTATMVYAKSVPIDIISTKACRSKRKARTAAKTPDITVAIIGTSVFGFTLARNLKTI